MSTKASNRPRSYAHVMVLFAILVAIAFVGLSFSEARASAWFLILILLASFAFIAGHGITGLWRGILIDARYKMSLSRLQFVAWTLLVLSAILTAATTNLVLGWESPLEFDIPVELWVLMGISTASLVGAPAVLSIKRDRKPVPNALNDAAKKLSKQGYARIDTKIDSVVIFNTDPRHSRWADLLKGEETGNATTVDLGKMQMLFITFVLVLSYGAAIGQLFAESTGIITELPPVQDGMNVLLGISHTGYLANKTVSHSPEATQPTQDVVED